MNAPEVSNIEVDCSGGPAPGWCISGGVEYPFSFNTANAVEFELSAERVSGDQPPATFNPSSGFIECASSCVYVYSYLQTLN